MTEITMPKLSDTMTEGVMGEWKKSVGDKVAKGDIIAEVETDKATMELESFASGVLLEQRIGAGETVAVGAVIGIIGEADKAAKEKAAPAEAEPTAPEAKPAAQTEAKQATPAEPKPATLAEPRPATPAEPRPATPAEVTPTPPVEGELPPEDQQTAEFRLPEPGPETDLREETGKMEAAPESQPKQDAPGVERELPGEKSAPVVRRRAQELGIDIAVVQGSGPGGRVLLDDLEKYAGSREASAEKGMSDEEKEPEGKGPARPGDAQVSREGEEHTLNRMQAAIAKTVSESWQTIPHFSVVQEIRMDRAEQVRRELKVSGIRVSLNDMIIKAAALTLLKFPKVNSSFRDGTIVFHQEINIGIMAKVPDGLLVPVVRGCETLSLRDIADRSRYLLERVRSGAISQPEISGGTFSISNLGMYGVNQFTAIILPPQVAILATGAVSDMLMSDKGGPTIERYMKASLSADHRVLDGVEAASFLKELKRILENPVQLLL